MGLLIGLLVLFALLAAAGVPGTGFIAALLGAGALWAMWTRVSKLQDQLDKLQRALADDWEARHRAQPTAPTAAAAADMPDERGWVPGQMQVDPAPAAEAAPQDAALLQSASTDAIRVDAAPVAEQPPAHDTAPDTVPMPELPPQPVAARVPAPTRLEPDETSPDVVSSLGRTITAWVTGGNTIVRAAVAILFIGVAFLLRYAAEHAVIPIEVRLAGVALGGLALVVTGWRLRGKRRGYALSLQGGGIGVIYLTLFAAFRLYGLLPGGLAFGLLAALAAVSALLAVLQNALPLAVLGFSGGFLAPVLTSTGQGSHVALFSYYLVLNLAIAWIASRQTWKLLNLVGFFFTFGIGLAWGLRGWRPELLASTEPFLVAHVLLYLYISVQYSSQLIRLREAGSPGLPVVDGSLLFGMPIAAFGLQAAMVRHIPYALAASAAAMAAVYLLLGRWLLRQGGKGAMLLVEGMLALGVIFLILVTPLALDARWTGAAWAVQGAGLAWIALRQQRIWALAMGLLLQLGAALSFWSGYLRAPELPLFTNGLFVGTLCLGLAALVTARLLERASRLPASERRWWRDTDPRQLHVVMLGAGVLQLLWGTGAELHAAPWAVPDAEGRLVALLLGWTVLAELLHRRLDWRAFSVPGRLTWVAATLLCFTPSGLLGIGLLGRGEQAAWMLFSAQGWAELVAVVGIGGWLMKRLDSALPGDAQGARGSTAAEYLLWLWTTTLQATAVAWLVAAVFVVRHEAWTPTAAVLPPALICMLLAQRLGTGTWPAAVHPRALDLGLLRPWLGLMLLWVLGVNLLADGSMQPLGYLPLLNPVDIGHAVVALYALRLSRTLSLRGGQLGRPWIVALAAAGFAWINSLLVRTLHHWAGTPMWTHGALGSSLVQTGLTILWTLLALVTMLYATRRAASSNARPVWIAGAALLGVVVLKLLLVDMAGVGTLYRIVSFIGVGLLMLVIGYVSPLPPAASEPKDSPREEHA